MLVRKAMLAACGAALIAIPGAAVAHGPADRGHHGDKAHGRPDSPGPSNHGKSHKCVPHRVAYVAAGTLVSHTLVQDGEDVPSISSAGGDRPTFSGDVTIDVKRTNRHAKPDKGTTKTYTLDHARVLVRLEDRNDDGVVDLADILPGSRVKVIGKVTKLAKRCDQAGFVPELKIRKLIVHAPRPAADAG